MVLPRRLMRGEIGGGARDQMSWHVETYGSGQEKHHQNDKANFRKPSIYLTPSHVIELLANLTRL
jgi:hypothetical protein